MPDSFYGNIQPNNMVNPADTAEPSLIAVLDQAKKYAHPIRLLDNKIRLKTGEIKEAEKELAACQKKMDGQNQYLQVLSSFWMTLAMIAVGVILSVVISVIALHALIGALVTIGEFLLIILLFLILYLWNNSNAMVYVAIGCGVLGALLALVYFLILAGSLFATFALRNIMTSQAQKSIRESERLFPAMSTKIEQLQKEKGKLEYERGEWMKHLNALRAKAPGVFQFIPEPLLQENALSFLLSALTDGRASGIKEAVALYERQNRGYQNQNGMMGSDLASYEGWNGGISSTGI